MKLHVRRSVFFRLLMQSFFTIFIVVLVAGTMTYYYFARTLRDEAYSSNMEILNQTKQVVEVVLNEVQKTAMSLAIDSDVRKAVQQIRWEMIEDYPVLKNISILFNNEVNSSNYIHSIYLYSKRSEKIISNLGVMLMNDFSDRQVLQSFETNREFSEWLDTRSMSIVTGDAADVISYLINVPITDNKKNGILAINIKEDLLYNAVVNVNSSKLGSVIILNKYGDVISSGNKAMLHSHLGNEPYVNEIIAGNSGYIIDKIDGERVFISYVTSKLNGWKYVAIIPYEMVFMGSNTIKSATIIISGLSLVLGLLMAFLVSGRYYKPVKSLVNVIAGYLATSNNKAIAYENKFMDEFGYLENSFDKLRKQNEEHQRKLHDNDLILKEHFLLNLVMGKNIEFSEIQEQMAYYELDMDMNNYLVMILEINHSDLSDSNLNAIPVSISQQIKPSCENIVYARYKGVVFERDQTHLVILLNFHDIGKDKAELYGKEIALDLVDHLKIQFGVNITIGIGCFYSSIADVPISYNEAVEALKYKMVSKANGIVFINDVITDRDSKRHAFAFENKKGQLINELRTGNYENAKSILDKIIDWINDDEMLSYKTKNAMFIQLISSIIAVASEDGEDTEGIFGPDYNPYYQFEQLSSFLQMKVWLYNILQITAKHVSDKRDNRNVELINKVVEYIERHYAEPITLQMIADNVYMNVTYFCKLFKDTTGKTFGGYLNDIRLNKAYALLKETDSNISYIANITGFGNKQNLIRAFKKHMGMTPTDYRRACAQQRLE